MDAPIPWPAEYREFLRLFNERRFFEAHEVLEDLWIMEVPPLRDYYKGLIQAAVALCHWERGNHSGARRLWLLARGYLAHCPPRMEGLDLAAFLKRMDTLFHPLVNGGRETPPPPPREDIPVLHVDDPA